MIKTALNVKYVAKLAKLFVTKDEEKMLEAQLDSTIKHVENLQDINTEHIVGTNEVTDLKNVSRLDEVKSSLSQEEALKNARKTYNGLFLVPVIIEEAIE